MIPYDFEYYKPANVQEAIDIYQTLKSQKKEPMYFSGGTEIITLGRLNKLRTKAIIDIKGIPECNVLTIQGDQLIMGAGVSLTQINETKLFPLLTESAGRVADHTSRCKITLGGNICGSIIYKEAVLPLLASDSRVWLQGSGGGRTVPLIQAFREQIQLLEGEFVVQIFTDTKYLQMPHRGLKKMRLDRIGYPLVSIAALKNGNRIQMAISGVCAFPFRSLELENEMNSDKPYEERIAAALLSVPAAITDDVEGSAGYREFVLKNTLQDILTHFEGVK